MILKKLTSIWGRSVKRIIKSQQSKNLKLVKGMFATVAGKAKRRVNPSRTRSAPASAPEKAHAFATTAPGKWLKSTYTSPLIDGARTASRMSYWLYLPDREMRTPMPLVVMLHGCAQSATQFAQGTRMNLLAEQHGFAVLYPQQSATPDPSRCWRWYKRTVQQGGGEVKSIVAILENTIQKHPIDPSRIYVAGLSAGAAMAHIVALNHPHLIAAVGLHSGTVFGAADSRMEAYSVMQNGADDALKTAIRHATSKFELFPIMPAILIHGEQDGIVRPINLVHLTRQFRVLNRLSGSKGAPLLIKEGSKPGGPRSGNAYSTSEYFIGKQPILKICEIQQLDHAWSGGDASVRFHEHKGPDASKMMWDFFAKHRREVETSSPIV
ncbi:extracellular catalytic domain type 1 short-chain-length polyhydroxyalkanoate depolymerase [Undibacterium arcticum]